MKDGYERGDSPEQQKQATHDRSVADGRTSADEGWVRLGCLP